MKNHGVDSSYRCDDLEGEQDIILLFEFRISFDLIILYSGGYQQPAE
jgi:hypothetical protein